jgi:hypothetical protein
LPPARIRANTRFIENNLRCQRNSDLLASESFGVVFRVDENNLRRVGYALGPIKLSVSANNNHVAGPHQVRGSAIDTNHTGTGFALNCVGCEAITIRNVVDLHLFELDDICEAQQIGVDGHAAFIVQLGLSDGSAMDLGFQ